jgi:alpha-tubulin suppressor-like RCC1 family protein
MIVKELCNKNIIDLIYGFNHYIARTYDNKFYCWGNNYFGQLGFGSEDQNEFHKNTPKLNNFLSDLNIIFRVKFSLKYWNAFSICIKIK